MLTSMSQINVELTSRCQKKTPCAMCGHQSAAVNPNLKYGDMDFALVESIAKQIVPPIVVSMHRDGEPTDHPRLGDALRVFRAHPLSIVTHGERLAEKADEIIDNCTTVTISVIPKDPDRDLQIASIAEFLGKKGDRRPMVQLKCVGIIDDMEKYKSLGLPIINRALHSKKGNWTYYRMDPPVPEIRVCLDLLSKPTIDWQGNFYACNRFDPNSDGLLGNLNESSLDELWNGPKRMAMLKAHFVGRRDLASKLCASCEYYGIPTPAG